jgi:hypothetical protein
VPPYGSVDAEGLFSRASVDLWRRVAEDRHLTYRFIAVAKTSNSTKERDFSVDSLQVQQTAIRRFN